MILCVFTHAQNALVELWGRAQQISSESTYHNNIFCEFAGIALKLVNVDATF